MRDALMETLNRVQEKLTKNWPDPSGRPRAAERLTPRTNDTKGY
jgi:hypothetical protein